MKAFVVRAFLSFAVLSLAAVGCAAQAQDPDEVLDEELADEGEIASSEQAATAQPLTCEDLVLHEAQQKFCGFQTGPLDDSPVFVTCTRTCTTERHWVFVPATPTTSGGLQCVSGETTCTGWQCPSCD